METFIESASKLLEAYPSATVSITYSNVSKRDKTENGKKASNVVKFKVYEPNSTKCVKYATSKTKELSRLLTYLGPRGVSVKRKNEDSEEKEGKKQKVLVGAASVMSNSKFVEPEPESSSHTVAGSTGVGSTGVGSTAEPPKTAGTPGVEADTAPLSSSSKKKKKKNNKKK